MNDAALQRELLLEVRQLRADQRATHELLESLIERLTPLAARDRATLERLLPVIREHIGNLPFYSRALTDFAQMDSIAGSDMRLALGNLQDDTHAVGNLLKKAADAGFGIRRLTPGAHGVRWELCLAQLGDTNDQTSV